MSTPQCQPQQCHEDHGTAGVCTIFVALSPGSTSVRVDEGEVIYTLGEVVMMSGRKRHAGVVPKALNVRLVIHTSDEVLPGQHFCRWKKQT